MTNKSKPRAILIDLADPDTTKEEAMKRLQELEQLVETYGGVVIVKTIQKKGVPDYETFIGKGKLQELMDIGKEEKADLLILNNILKPTQIYNLNEKLRKIDMETWDRIDLILQIFDKHAQSAEAKLQIQLSKIRHMGPRIFGMGEELSRQGGAMGMRAGQGESNIEVMKRHLRRQEQKIMEKLQHYEVIRKGHRKRRRRKNLKTVALVGYTNAGKSSLLNALTGKGAYVADELFATLDTRVGKLYIPGSEKIVDGKYQPGTELLISDTIGFIQNLPPSLIQAFKSTLSETVDAELILHVIDSTDPEIHKKIKVVEDILTQLDLQERKKVYVFNKIDLLHFVPPKAIQKPDQPKKPKGIMKAGKETAELLGWGQEGESDEENITDNNLVKLKEKYQKFNPVCVSAIDKENLEELVEEILKSLK